MRIFFVRHCISTGNSEGLISGCLEFNIVNKHICINGEYLLPLKGCVIITSPLSRCIETSRLIADYTKNNSEIIQNTDLLERDMGDWEGEKRGIVRENYSDMFTDGFFNYKSTPPNGESFSKFYARVSRFVRELEVHSKANDVLICSHNQTLKLLYCILGNKEISSIWRNKQFECGVVEELVF